MPFGKKPEEVTPEKPLNEVEGGVAITPDMKTLDTYLKSVGSTQTAEQVATVYTEETRPKPVNETVVQLPLPLTNEKTKGKE